MLPVVEINPSQTPTAIVVWMHGLGADGYNFVDIVPQLELPLSLAVRFVFPHAPIRPVSLNNGYEMRAWYDIDKEMFSREDIRGIRESSQAINELITVEQKEYHIPSSRVILAGFSQGGAMALHCGLRYHERLGGIIGLSTYLPLATTLSAEKAAANNNTPILLAHGTADSLIPIAMAEQSHRVLQNLAYPVSWHTYPIPHTVCAAEVKDIAAWLIEILGY